MSVHRTDTSDRSIASLLRDRRTVHDFTDERPPLDVIVEAIDAGRWAPNHLRTEPWRFYLLDHEIGMQVAELNAVLVAQTKGEKVASVKRKRWAAMPGWLVVTCPTNSDEIRQREDYAACCCAVHNISLALWEQRIGMKWTTGQITREREFFELLGLNITEEFVVGLFWFGYPATVPNQLRKPLGEVLTHVGPSTK